MITKKNLTYIKRADIALTGDLYLPEGKAPHPILVAVSGGAWLRGSRQQLQGWGEYLAAQGYAVFSIDYRQSTNGTIFPENVDDIKAALSFIEEQGESLGLDVERIGLLGASAGAHLSALTALTTEKPIVKALILTYGVYDLVKHWQQDRWRQSPNKVDLTERMLGCSPYDNQQRYFDASPIRQISYNRAKNLKAFITWGTDDTAVLAEQSEMFSQALEQAGAVVRTEKVIGANHFWFSKDPINEAQGYTAAVAPKITRFLDQFFN